MATIRSLANKVSADAKKNRESASNKKRQERLQNVTLSSNTAITSAIEKLNETAKPSTVSANLSGEAWTRATPSQTAIPKDKQKNFTESQLKTYQAQMDQATRDANDWSIREEMEFLGSGSLVPKDVLDRTNKSIYKSSAEANRAAQLFGQQKTSLLNQNYENRSQDILKTVNADKTASSALKTAQGLENLQRQIRYELEWSSAEGIDRSSAETRKLGLQYGLTEAECKNIWSMQAAITKKLKQAKAAVEQTGVSYDDAYEYLRRQELSKEAASKKTALETKLDDNGLEMAKHTGLSVLANMGKGVDYVAGIAGNWGHNDERNLDTYRPMNSDAMSATNYVNTVRGKVGSEIQEDATAGLKKLGASEGVAQFGGEASKFLYDTGMSIVDNAAQMAVAGVAGAGTAGTGYIVSGLMGTGAAADQMKNILDNGGTNDQAMVGGFAAGVAEALFEKVSIDALLSPKNVTNFKSWAKEALKQGGVEASEEVCTELANMFTDALIRGQDSDFQRAIAYYQTEEGGGLSLTEAKKKAYLDAIGQVALAGLGGFISGGVMQGVKGGVGLGNYKSTLKKVGQAVKTSSDISDQITKGLAADKDSEAYKLATEVKAQYESGKTVDQNTLGKLTVENIKNASDAIEAAKQNQTETAARVVAEAQREMQTTGQVSGETLAKLKTVATASQDTSPAADISAKELATQAQITQAENPDVNVLDAAATLFLEKGITKKPFKAQEKAKIVQALIDGKEDVKNTDINKLNPENPKARELFTQLTGVQFPEGKMTQEQLYNLYRSAHDVAMQAQSESVAIDSAEGREAFPGVNRVLDETTTAPETSAAQPTLNQEAETARATAQRYFDEAGLPDFQTFSEWFLQEVDPNADEGKIASAYGQLLKDVGSVVSKDGQRMNRQQFEEFVKGGKDGDQLTDTDIDELWFSRVLGEIDQQKRVNESALKARKETLNRVSDSINRALKPYGLSCTVDYDMDSNVNGDVGADGVIHLNGNVVTTESAMIYVLGHEVVHKAPAEFVKSIEDAFNKLNKDGLIKDAELKYRIEHKTEVIEFQSRTYLNHLTKLAQQEAAKNGETTFDAEAYQEKLKSGGVDGQSWGAYVEEEYAADLMRSVFLSDPDILGKLAAENPSAVEESLTWTQKMLRGFTKKGQQEKEIKKILSGLEANLIQGLREGRPADHEDMRPSQDRHSVSTMLEAINLDIESKDGSGRLIVRDINGNEVTEVTEKMIRQSRLGAVLRESVTRGRISAEKMDKQITFFKDFTNQLLKTQDLDMLFAVSGSLGFQEVPRGTKLDSDVGKDTKFAGFTNNSDPQYKRTVDFTTICLKTQAVIDAMSETMMKLDHGLTESEIVDIVYKNTHDAGEPVPCPVCYVFSRWVGLGGLFDNMSNWQEMYKNSSKEDLQKVIDGLQSKIERIVGESVKVKEDGTTETVSEGKARTKLKNELTKQSRGIKAGAIQSELDAITAEAKALPTKAAIKKEGKAQGWTAEDVDKRTSEILDQKAKLQQKKNKLREQMKAKNLDAMKAEDLNLSAEEQAQLDSLNADLMILDQWSWLTQVRMKDGYEPVPHDILFDINKGNEFATNYPDAWKFRTTRGPAMGKAAAPYSPMHLGQIITGAGMSDISKLGVQANNKVLDSENGELTKDALKSLDASQNAMRAQNLLNGLRFQSTSDFRFEYALDYLLAFMDLQAIGGKVQLYTKVPEAVGFLASMGAEVNCSLMPLGLGYDPVTKELKFSSVTGMNADDAFNLARSYDNVQTIMVGTSDEHIRLCMADDRIQFIIPYHASGSSEARYQSMMQTVQEQVGFRDDYSEYQTDKLIETEDPDILNARSARKKILTAQAATLTESELATIRKLKDSGNDILWELYKRFNGRNIDGVPEPLNQKYLEPSQRSNDPVYYDENCLHLNLNENGEVVSTEPVKLGADVADMIFPFEYWDKTTTLTTADQNGEAFKDYCKLLGIRPRFSGWSKGTYKAEKDFSKESGYWKTLIDRRMYNRDGSYHEQKTIDVTSLDQRFFSRKDSVKGIVQPSQLNDKSKTAEIAEKSAREIATRRGEEYPSTSGKRYSVIGPNAYTANIKDLGQAVQMQTNGATNQDIWEATGWWQGKDGYWRFEIDDSEMQVLREKGTGLLEEFITHDQLFAAYPWLKKIPVKVDISAGTSAGYWNGSEIHIKKGRAGDEFKSTLIHEIQHVIQEHENFSSGANYDIAYRRAFLEAYERIKDTPEFKEKTSYLGRVRAIEQEILTQLQNESIKNNPHIAGNPKFDWVRMTYTIHELYQSEIGETEARNTSERVGYDEQKRQSEAPFFADSGLDASNYNTDIAEFRRLHLMKLGLASLDKLKAPLYNQVRKYSEGSKARGIREMILDETGIDVVEEDLNGVYSGSGKNHGSGRTAGQSQGTARAHEATEQTALTASEESGASSLPEETQSKYSITEENDAMENEKAIRKLENEIEDINSKLDLASVDGLSETEVRRLRNQLTKNQYELDQRNAAERKAAVRTPLQTVLDNLDNYRAIDLESIANQLTDNVWDDVETLSTEELKSGIREILQERAEDLSPLEMQSPKFGVYVRKPSTSAGVRYSITPEFEQWYRSMFDNPADADASIGKATRYNELMQKYGAMDEANNAARETPVPVKSTKKKAVSETVRTVMGAEATPNSRIPTIVEAVADGKLSHVPTANNVYSRRAAGTLRREGWAKTLRDWTAEVRSGKSSPDLVAMGAVLLNNAGNSNATGTEYLDILSDYVELMSRNGKSLQMGNLFKTLSPEGRLYMAEKIAKNINEKIRERKGNKTKTAEDAALDDIIEVRDTALQTIKDIFDALSEDRNKTSHGVPVEDWMKEVGNRLAGQISSNMADKVQRQRPITKVIQEDLLKFAESYALPKGKNLGVERRASDRVADFFNNRDAYVEAWNQARSELRNRYKDDPEKLDALEELLNGTLGYNGTGSDAVMMRAVAEFALDGDTKARDIVMRAKMGDRKALEARVFNALNSKIQATGSDADILRDAVSRFVSNTLADSGIDSEKALANSVKSAMKDIGVKMSDIIRQGAESKEAVANRIAEMLVKEYKVSQEGAAEAARIVVDKFTEMTAEAAQAKLESMFKSRPTRTERSLLLRFDELVNLGAFTSDRFNHLATQKIFGVDVQIDPTLIDEYRAAKTDEARDEVLDKITTNIAEQIPATKMEQFTALRYLNMLGNLKTQVRNVIGNLAYQPVRMMKDQVGAAIETAAQNIFGMDIERTKAFGRDMETYKFGLKDFEEVRQIIMGGGKYNDNARFSQDIESKRRIFKSALLEKYRVLTNKAMDIGDAGFSKLAYADALSGYMKANGTTWSKASEELRDKARVYAIQQAAEATYRDNNAFSDAISKMRIQNADTWAKRAINTIGEGLMPFRKTPANILVRTVEYSPVGLALSAINAGRAKAGADVTATQVIDQLAKGLTGSALMVLGYALANLGVLRGGDDDEEKKAAFDDLLGHQAYAIELGGYSITLDWLAPEAVPLFLGAQVSKATEDGSMSPGDVMRTLASIPDPILEMSMLQGLNDALKNASSYGDDQALVRFTGNALWSYLTQGLTSTLMGQAVRAVNNTRMTTYVDKNSDMPSGMQSALGKFTAKLPLPNALKYNQIPYIDAWGRMEQNADNAALNFVFQFANPAYVSKVDVSDTESELERLYGATKNTSVLPQRAPKKFSHDGQVVDLTADQYVVFASDVGRTSYNTVTDLTGSKLYQNLSDADKARAVENVYDYAKQTAKESLVGYKVDNWVKEAEASGDPALYCAIKAATYNIEGIPDPKDPGKSISNSKGLQVMEVIYKMPGLTEKQKQTYIEMFVGKSIQGYSESKVKRELEKMRRQAAK